ncbi:TPA: exotoxin [Yersinia enterocolitica]|nr:exotoxin [Yersinia enterocolitica]HEC4986149.1 exotoxin [Yersinia enterocolitica]HEN3462671.1 exotoxin [Yersinia enterocolitica]
MFSGIKNILTYLPALLLIILAGLSLHFYNEADEWHDKADAAAKERDEARFILTNQIRMVNIINEIAKANEDEKKQITLDSQRTKAGIKSDIANDGCTNLLVPTGAIDRLRAHSNKIRNRPASTNPEQLAF